MTFWTRVLVTFQKGMVLNSSIIFWCAQGFLDIFSCITYLITYVSNIKEMYPFWIGSFNAYLCKSQRFFTRILLKYLHLLWFVICSYLRKQYLWFVCVKQKRSAIKFTRIIDKMSLNDIIIVTRFLQIQVLFETLHSYVWPWIDTFV